MLEELKTVRREGPCFPSSNRKPFFMISHNIGWMHHLYHDLNEDFLLDYDDMHHQPLHLHHLLHQQDTQLTQKLLLQT